MKCDCVNIIVGTYNDFIVGYNLHPRLVKQASSPESNGMQKIQTKDPTSCGDFEIDQSFAIRSHSGVIKTIESSKLTKFLASSGSDEIINLYSLKKSRLSHTSDGAINCFEFIQNNHLIAGSEDGNIYIYNLEKKQQFNLMKIFKGHKKAVTALSLHPSNKLFLSISKDNTMRTWNLITGRPAFVTNIKHESHLIKWSPTGETFVIAAEDEIHLFKQEDGSRVFSTRFEKRVNALEFLEMYNNLIVASDDGKVTFLCLKTNTPLHSFKAHDARCKALRLIDKPILTLDETNKSFTHLLVTCSTDGTINVWDIKEDLTSNPDLIASVNIGARITCMTTNSTVSNLEETAE